MESSGQPPVARRSVGEWLFQLLTITIGVLIALSFDSLLKWNADRILLEEARATIALEIADNQRELEAHLAAFAERVAQVDHGLQVLVELDAGTAPASYEIPLNLGFPSLNDASWLTAERTGAIALMKYSEVQQLAELYMIQSLFSDTMQPLFLAVSETSAMMNAPGDPFAIPSARDAMRARLIETRAYLQLNQSLGQAVSDGYSKLER